MTVPSLGDGYDLEVEVLDAVFRPRPGSESCEDSSPSSSRRKIVSHLLLHHVHHENDVVAEQEERLVHHQDVLVEVEVLVGVPPSLPSPTMWAEFRVCSSRGLSRATAPGASPS